MSGTLGNGSFYGGVRGRRSVAGLTLAETEYAPGFAIPEHDHEHPFFCLGLRGSFEERFERARWTGGATTVFYHPAAAPHAETFGSGGARLFNVQLGGAWLARLDRFDVRPPERQVEAAGGRLAWMAAALYREFRDGDTAADLAIDGLALALLAELTRAAAPRETSSPPGWLRRAEELLHERATDAMDIAGIADAVDVHPVHLARVFRRHHGCSPAEYLRRVRLRQACRLLAETDRPLAAVALSTGYADQSHFTRQFKRALGVTPGAYRRLVA